MRLQKDMYRQHQFEPGLFGLCHDQMSQNVGELQNAGWYNDKGEYLGHGDLNNKQVQAIADGLEHDETFVVMRESDWRDRHTIKERGGPIGDQFYMELGRSFLARYCTLIIKPGVVYYAVPEDHDVPVHKDITFERIERGNTLSMLLPRINLASDGFGF